MCACILRLNNLAKDNKTATPLVLSNQTKITCLMQHAGELSRLYSQSFVREIQGALRTRASFPSLRGARYTAKALTPYTLICVNPWSFSLPFLFYTFSPSRSNRCSVLVKPMR